MKNALIKIIVISVLIMPFAGCALITCDVQGLRDMKEAHAKVFDKDLSSCYALTVKALSGWKAVIFKNRQDDYIVAMEFEKVFRSCINTTELGIFFTQTAPNKTEVKVTSMNYNLSEFIARKLFTYIERDGKVSVEEEAKPIAESSRNPFKKQ